MANARFHVGQAVICRARFRNEKRGLFCFSWLRSRPKAVRHAGRVLRCVVSPVTGGWAYYVSGCEFLWEEECLMPQHLPSEQSFDQIVTSLKRGASA